MFDKEVVAEKAKSLLKVSVTLKKAYEFLDEILLPTVGSEGDIKFWNEVRAEVAREDIRRKNERDSLDQQRRDAIKNAPVVMSMSGDDMEYFLQNVFFMSNKYKFDGENYDDFLETQEDESNSTDFSPLKGYTVVQHKEGTHHNDSQIVDYTFDFISPSGITTALHTSMSLMTGWDFSYWKEPFDIK